ncbi:MAG: hypothetical protein ACRCX4_01195 [Bacteroidales bacterium]
MMKKNNIRSISIRFRRWSRKQYAVFCSLGKQISIGCLRRGIADQALRKNALVLSGGLYLPDSLFVAESKEYTDAEIAELKESISEILLLKIVLPELSSDLLCPDYNTNNTNTIC